MMETMERMVSRVTRLTSLRLFRARSMINESLHIIPGPYKSQCPHHLWKPGQWVCKLSLRDISPLPSGCRVVIVLFTVSLTENIWRSHHEDQGSIPVLQVTWWVAHAPLRHKTWSGDTHSVHTAPHTPLTHTPLFSLCLTLVSPDSRPRQGRGLWWHCTLHSGHPERSVNISDGASDGGDIMNVNSSKIVSLQTSLNSFDHADEDSHFLSSCQSKPRTGPQKSK